MAVPYKLIKIALLLIQIPVLFKAKNKKEKVLKRSGLRAINRRRFILLKKLYRFSAIGKVPLINKSRDFMIGVYQGHKIGLFNYSYLTSIDATVIIISMNQSIPKFLLKPKGLFSGLFKSELKEITLSHIRFNGSAELFAREKDHFAVAGIFTRNVLDYFVGNNQLWVESDGYKLLIFHQKEILYDGDKLDGMLDRAIDLKRMLSPGVQISSPACEQKTLTSKDEKPNGLN